MARASTRSVPREAARARRRAPRLAFVLGLASTLLLPGFALLLAGCGDVAPAGAPASSTNLRLPLRLAADAASIAAPALYASHDLLAERAQWNIEAPEVTDALPPGATGNESRRLLQLHATRTDQLVRLTLPGPLDVERFDSVELMVAFNGHGAVRVELGRQGEMVAQTDAVMLRSGKDPAHVAVTLPRELLAAGPFDALALRFDGDARTIGVRHVDLVDRSPAALLPDAAHEPELIKLGDEARRGVGLATGRPVQADFDVPAGGRLRLSCCQPPSTRRPGAGARLRVEVEDGRGGRVEGAQAFEADPGEPSRWHTLSIELAPLSGHATATFRFETDDGAEGACALAEVALVAPAPAGSAAAPAGAPSAAGARPNVLLITSDTHRGDHVGAARSGVAVDTPVLDALAAEGTIFLDCFTPINVTNPSHVALMTGRHPRDVGVLDNSSAVGAAAPTLAELFRDAGYVTWAAVSTEHLGPGGSGLGQGFDRVSWPPHKPRRAEETVADVLRWLPERDGRPLFVWLHVFDAHWPYAPPGEWDRRDYPRDKDPFSTALPPLPVPDDVLPPDLKGLRDVEFPRAQYRAEVSYLDHELARVLDARELAGAIVAVVGDHGEAIGEHGIWCNHDNLYPEVLHVPLILRWPGGPAGARMSGPVTHLDVGRTLLDLAGLQGTDFPGRSLALPPAPTPAPRFALAVSGLSASVTDGDLHLILHLGKYRTPRMQQGVEKHQTELYDLRADPGCLHDLLLERQPAARQLRRHLIDWLRSAEDLGWLGERSTDPEALAELAQLGYAGAEPAHAASLWDDDDCAWCKRLK